MFQQGCYSLRDLNENTGNGSWSLHQQNTIFAQHHDLFSTRPAIDINEDYDKEQLRQTILKHDSMFRHQLYELHRLYKIQRDMMNDMRSKELNGHMMPAGTSQFSLYSSGIPVADYNGRQYSSNLSLDHGRLSMSGAGNIQRQFGSMKENVLPSGYGTARNGLRLDCKTLETGSKKLQRRLFDLELPADAYIDDEEDGQGVSEVSMVDSYRRSRNHEVTCDRDGNLSIHAGVQSGCNNDVLSANLHSRNPHGLSNLNEPIKVTEAYPRAFNDVLGKIVCSKEELERQVLSSNSHSGFQGLAKFSQDPGKGREVGVSLSNMHLETERRQKGWLAYNIEAGQTAGNGCSLTGSFPHEDFPTSSRLPHVKKKIFGVEICERNLGASVEGSHLLMQQPFVPQSNVAQSESSSISSWRELHSGLSQDMTTVQSGFIQSNKSSVTLMVDPKVTEDKLLPSSKLQSTPSINAEASSQNYISCSSQLKSKESRVCDSSNGFDHRNGISDGSSASERFAQNGAKQNYRDVGFMMDGKSADQKKADAVPPDGYHNDTISQWANISSNGTSKQSPHGGLSWLKGVPSCNGDSSEESQGSSQMNMHSLQNSFKQFIDKTEMMRKSSFQSYVQDSSSAICPLDAEHRRKETGECSSNKKILGFSISEKPCTSKELLSSSSPSKLSYTATVVDNTDSLKIGSHNTEAHDAISPMSGEHQKVEGLIEKGLINQSTDSRCNIDLNLSFVDEGFKEEVQPTFSSSRANLKNCVLIDLEAPAKVEEKLDLPPGSESVQIKSDRPPGSESVQSKLDRPPGFEPFQSNLEYPPGFEPFRSNLDFPALPPGFESFQNKDKEPVNLLQSEFGKLHEGLIRGAAEALVSISSSCMPTQVDACCHQSTAFLRDPLHWFVDIISSYENAIENEVGSLTMRRDIVHHEDIIPDGMDYFEYMTLNLTESNVEECCYEPQVFENPKPENILPKRPRRGQARRGRQRKDFQRDVLPTITSLLKNEVTEDLQTIEGLIQATGGTWKSSLALKTTTRNGAGRRKRRLANSEVCPPETQLPKCQEVALDDGNLTGWGKRTRRPPRQRFLISNPPPLTIK